MPEAQVEFGIIEFVGELTIRTIADAHQRLSAALAESSVVKAEVAADAAVDLSFVQLLESARRTARETGVAFDLATPAAGQLREALERGGFLAAPEDRGFWLAQTEGR